MADMNTTYLGYLFTILSAAGFASASLFLKLALGAGMSAWGFTLVSTAIGLCFLVPLTARRGSLAFPEWRQAWKGYLLYGAYGAVATIAFNVALVYLTISLATILLFTYPAFVALGAWLFLGQRPTGLHIAVLALALVGVILTVDIREAVSGAASLPGILLALLTAIAHGAYLVLGERVTVRLSAVSATTVTRLAILGGVLMLRPTVITELPGLPGSVWLLCLTAALLSGVAPYFLLNIGIRRIGANLAAIASVAELPFALALGLLFMGDRILPPQWAGAALIAAAVVISNRMALPAGERPVPARQPKPRQRQQGA
jgi:drug/metabolite transporter, DME family